MGCTYSSRGARVTDTTATTDTIIAIAEERAELVTERVMRKGKGPNRERCVKPGIAIGDQVLQIRFEPERLM